MFMYRIEVFGDLIYLDDFGTSSYVIVLMCAKKMPDNEFLSTGNTYSYCSKFSTGQDNKITSDV